MPVQFEWRGEFANDELNRLHAEAFTHPLLEDDWKAITGRHSLGWVTARHQGELVGFVNVIGDGTVHAWIQDEMVARHARRQGIGVGLIAVATNGARAAGCEWLHVDFDEDLRGFYIDKAGFTPTGAGLIDLSIE
ncbi:MAG TPA: GNAT family N-acetyltransferase [Acidimicrobiia bacterium]|nr:GNAT family N-acetyltransferase [Acidimicrobiia bacterium]